MCARLVLFVAGLFCIALTIFGQRQARMAPPDANYPKDVLFTFKVEGTMFELERMEGHKIILRTENKTLDSTPIRVEGQIGKCKIPSISPGAYGMEIPVIRLKSRIQIPAKPTRSVEFEVILSGRGIIICESNPKSGSH